MSDRELLELAAKAAGYHLHPQWNLASCGIFLMSDDYDDCSGIDWNPLEDDGDVFRLAVKLGIFHSQPHVYKEDRFALFERFYKEEIYSDKRPSESTRRAIVRVAAEIGRNMP